jgi:pimeloyl-ACP methyl ester carboxylesterase
MPFRRRLALAFACGLVLALSGCFEDGGGSLVSPTSTSTFTATSARYAALETWAQGATPVLAGDTDLAASSWSMKSRWDSVVDLSKASGDLSAILADWNARTPVASSWNAIDSLTDSLSVTRLVSFTVGGVSQGALVRSPLGASGKLPVILFCHPSDDGMSMGYMHTLVQLMGTLASQVLIVAPAFRGETASIGTDSVTSPTISQSPWDRDVDDALAALTASLGTYPADPSHILALGYSRGGGVALLAALRDARIGSVFDISGPADLFSPSFQALAIRLVNGGTSDLPGIPVLDTLLIKPFAAGTISADSLRRGMLRRSAARWALSGLLPTTLAIHGTADTTVNIDQSDALVAATSQATLVPASGSTHLTVLISPALDTNLAPFLKSRLGL